MAQVKSNSTELTRSLIWSNNLKMTLEDEMQAQQYVSILGDFPDGETFNIPSVGQRVARDYEENEEIQYTPFDTGNFTFVIDKYISDGIYITRKNQQDMFYTAQLEAQFEPKMNRAIMVDFETTTLAAPEVGIVANSKEEINGVSHRFAGGNAGKIEVADFAYARHALKKADVPCKTWWLSSIHQWSSR